MSRAIALCTKEKTQNEKLQERIEYLQMLLKGEDSKCHYDYYTHSREFLSDDMNYGAFVRTKNRETKIFLHNNDHFKTQAS